MVASNIVKAFADEILRNQQVTLNKKDISLVQKLLLQKMKKDTTVPNEKSNQQNNQTFNLNTSFQLQQALNNNDLNNPNISKIIYQTTFLKAPPCVIAILIQYPKKHFIFLIYNQNNQKTLTQKVKLKEVRISIPFIDSMIQLELSEQLGRKVFKVFKNRLITQFHKQLG
jgi:hypothetical protein